MKKLYIGYDKYNKNIKEESLSKCFVNTDYFVCADIQDISTNYLYHLMIPHHIESEFTYTISDNVIKDIHNGTAKLLFDYSFESRNNSIESEYNNHKNAIKNTLNKYNIQQSYIYIDSNPYNTHKLDLYFNRFIIDLGRACLHTVSDDSEVLIVEKEQNLELRKYKISCFNRRPDENRFKFVNEFKDNPNVLCTLGVPEVDDLNYYKEQYPDLIEMLPIEYDLSLDLNIPNAVSKLQWEVQQVSYIQVVNETLFNSHKNHMFINEKTLKPISCLQPFIVSGMTGSLAHLHELGFKTFSKWWDESYDLETDFAKRTDKIINVVNELCERSHNEHLSMLSDMYPVLDHNRKILMKLPKKHSIDLYKQIINTGF